MCMMDLHALFPDLAERETPWLLVRRHPEIPSGEYALNEIHCVDPACDCRRLMLQVLDLDGGVHAMISLGLDRNAPDAGPLLDPLNDQGPHAGAWLSRVTDHLARHPDYVARLERHHGRLKAAVADPDPRIREILAPVPTWAELLGSPPRRDEEWLRRRRRPW